MNHDSFFKITFQDKENAIDFFKNRLPPELLKDIDFESLEIVKDSFIDPNFRDVHSDMLFKVSIAGKQGYIYLLLEHKSYMDAITPFQLLKYIVSIWGLHLSQLKKDDPIIFPIILPMVLYHGKDEWEHSTDFLNFQERIAGWEKYQVNFSYVLYDFSTYKDEEIKGQIVTRLFTLLFKYINREDFEDKLYSIIELLSELMEKTTAMEYVEAVLLYLLSGVRKIELDKIEKMLENTKSGRTKEMLATLAERLEERGYKRGLEESKAIIEEEKKKAEEEKKKAEWKERRAQRKEKLRTAINMKKKGCDLDFIAEIVDLKKKKLERLFRFVR